MMNAVYAGSFDCYTNGHHDIVKKAAVLFDRLYIVIAVNSEKRRRYPAELMQTAIARTLENDCLTNCTVCIHDGVVADFCIENDIGYTIRGLRNRMDYDYEENIAAVNKLIAPNLETVYFRADNNGISSSLIAELSKYRKDFSGLVPPAVNELLLQCETE